MTKVISDSHTYLQAEESTHGQPAIKKQPALTIQRIIPIWSFSKRLQCSVINFFTSTDEEQVELFTQSSRHQIGEKGL